MRTDSDIKKWRLEMPLAVPRQEVEDMCADCAQPASPQSHVSPPYERPCTAGPGQRAIQEDVRRMLEAFRKRYDAKTRTPTPPKPEPLAIVPSGLPVAEVVQRLQE